MGKMTLTEAINHAREVAKDHREICTTTDIGCDKFSKCIKCAEEHEQLAEWLEELKKRREAEPSRNGWIPVCERLPKSEGYVLVSFENFTIPDIARYEVDENGSGAFYPGDEDKSYISFGLFVNAWMPLPELYREE